jgi:uncharacterized repeat protein (TIGR02543 family)
MKAWRSSLTAVATLSMVSLGLVGGVNVADSTTASASSCVAAPVTHVGKIAGLQAPQSVLGVFQASCTASASNGVKATPPYYIYYNTPPITYGGGPVMDTTSTPVTITPIYWTSSPSSFAPTYQGITEKFISDIAAASGSSTDFLSVLTQYYSGTSSTPILNSFVAGTPINDTDTYPTSGGCTADTGAVYSDSSGYSACLTNAQIETEISSVLSAHSLPSDLNHLYLMYLPKGVESCLATANNTGGGSCTLSSQGGAFCGYHSYFASGLSDTVYADLPYAIADSPSLETCSSDGGTLSGGGTVGNQSPNGNVDADTEISVTSHEIGESLTDPNLNAWYDSTGNEVGDDCEYIYGDSLAFGGTPGAEYNQTINGDHYFIQEQFSDYQYSNNANYSCALMNDQSVLFDPNGGSGVMVPQNEALNAVATIDPNAFTRQNYTFTGWNSSSNGSGTTYPNLSNVEFTTSATFYAQWALNPNYTVTFNPNGGTGLMGSDTSNSAGDLPANAFSRAGYTFEGWNTSPSGTGTSYANLASYGFGANATLYAQWATDVPSAPVIIKVVAGDNSARISWTTPSAPFGMTLTGYRIHAGYQPGDTSVSLNNGTGVISGTTFHATHLVNGTKYYFEVNALDSAGASVDSTFSGVTIPRGATTTTLRLSKAVATFSHERSTVFRVRVVSHNSSNVPRGTVDVTLGSKVLCRIHLSSAGLGSCVMSSHLVSKGRHRVVAKFVANSYDTGSKSKSEPFRVT